MTFPTAAVGLLPIRKPATPCGQSESPPPRHPFSSLFRPVQGAFRCVTLKCKFQTAFSVIFKKWIFVAILAWGSGAVCHGQEAPWSGQRGTVTIKQIYLHNDIMADKEKNIIKTRADVEYNYAKSVYSQIGISLRRDGHITFIRVSENLDEANILAWRDSQNFGSVLPVIYANQIYPYNTGETTTQGRGLCESYKEMGREPGKAVVLMNHPESYSHHHLFYYSYYFEFDVTNLKYYDIETTVDQDTLAHEIGHILLNDARFLSSTAPSTEHTNSSKDLMAYGKIRRHPKWREEFVAGGDKSMIEFLPMAQPLGNGEYKYINQVEAMYTASSYVTGRTPGTRPVYLAVGMDFKDPVSENSSWKGSYASYSALPTGEVRVLKAGERLDGSVLPGRSEILINGQTQSLPAPFEVSAYMRRSGPSKIQLNHEFAFSGIPENFTQPVGDSIFMGNFTEYFWGVSGIKVEKVVDGKLQVFQENTAYQVRVLAYNTHQLTHMARPIFQDGAPVRVLVEYGIPTATAPTRGDFNSDSVLNHQDVAQLYTRMGQVSPDHDLNGDGIVSFADVLELGGMIPGFLLGDLNSDGRVDGADLSAMQAAWQTSAGRAGGDINGDGTVDELDLALLAEDWDGSPELVHGVLLARPENMSPVAFETAPATAWEVSWSGHAGRTYQVETSSDLVAWTPQGEPVAGEGKPLWGLVEAAPGRSGFIRLRGTSVEGTEFGAEPRFSASRLSWDAGGPGEIFGIEVWTGEGEPGESGGQWFLGGSMKTATGGRQSILVGDGANHYRILRIASGG
ncbi:MAG: hypothetical protein KF712_13175 [Akkermansiaceae bacterium]|nr:hypothetical protein [Akkermansiaceae bacterium]